MKTCEEEMTARSWRVTGRVQGVFFRAQVARKARQLGLLGLAKNLQDGSVHIIACGRKDAVEELRSFIWGSPGSSRVDEMHEEPLARGEEKKHTAFVIC